jgi:hypothetical protein
MGRRKMGRKMGAQNGAKWVSLNCAIFFGAAILKKGPTDPRVWHRSFLWAAAFSIPPESLRQLADEATTKRAAPHTFSAAGRTPLRIAQVFLQERKIGAAILIGRMRSRRSTPRCVI